MLQENARLHAERAERSKQHNERLLLLQKDKIIENEWKGCMNEWKTTLVRLEECFNVLFPRIGEDLKKANTTQTKVVAAVSADDYQDDTDSVDWVGADEDSESGGADNDVDEKGLEQRVGSSSSYSASGGAPYTLVRHMLHYQTSNQLSAPLTFILIFCFFQTIQLSTAARDLETADNAVLLHTIRELSKQLARVAVPRLLHWKGLFAQCAVLYEERVAEMALRDCCPPGEGAEGGVDGVLTEDQSVLGKRPVSHSALSTAFSSSSSSSSSSSMSPAPLALTASQLEVHRCQAELQALLHSIRVMLTGKCKDLLKDEIL
jgi:hypothetical protein